MKDKIIYILILSISLFTCESDSSDTTLSSSESTGGEYSSGVGGSTARFTVYGDYLYTVDNENINAFRITYPEAPVLVSSEYQYGGDYETIFAFDEHLYFGTRNGLYIYSLDNPGYPSYLSNYEHVYSCDPVVVDSSYAYVTMRDGSSCGRGVNQLEIIDVTNPASPKSEQVYEMTNPKGLGIDGDLLFLCDEGLKVYDKTDIYQLDLIESFDIEANDVIPYNDVLIVTGDDGIRQYDYTQGSLVLLSEILPEEKK